jgi:hypothetical protein
VQFQIWNNNQGPLPCLSDLCPLILVTHDESTFFQNDKRKTCWSHQDSQPAPKPKGEGQSLMVSDFLMAEWGHLCNDNRSVFLFISCSHFLNQSVERLALYSNRRRIATDTSMQRHLSPKLIVQLTCYDHGLVDCYLCIPLLLL